MPGGQALNADRVEGSRRPGQGFKFRHLVVYQPRTISLEVMCEQGKANLAFGARGSRGRVPLGSYREVRLSSRRVLESPSENG